MSLVYVVTLALPVIFGFRDQIAGQCRSAAWIAVARHGLSRGLVQQSTVESTCESMYMCIEVASNN